MKLAVLAAGIGSRFGGVKQIAPIGPCGESILEYNVYNAIGAGFDSVVFLIRKEIEEDFTNTVLSRLPSGLKVEIAYQSLEACLPGGDFGQGARFRTRSKPWGTGHALLCAREFLEGGRFAVINGDDFYGRSGFEAVGAFLREAGERGEAPADGDFCFAAYRLGRVLSTAGTVSRAVCEVDEKGLLRSIVEHTSIEERDGSVLSLHENGETVRLSGDLPVSMNLWGLDPSYFPWAERMFGEFLSNATNMERGEFYLPGVVASMLKAGSARVRALPVDEEYFGLTNSADILEARAAIAQRTKSGYYPSPLWGKGVV